MKYIIAIITVLLLSQNIKAQQLEGISARFNDAFVEWDVYTEDEEGTLSMTWQNPDKWSQWNYRIGEQTGTIKTKWNDDYGQWEIRGGNKIITAQMIWSGDPRQWRITDNKMSIELKCRFSNDINEWIVNETKYGTFKVLTSMPNDPRDWVFEDELSENISLPMKMTIVFLAIFNSIPKQ